MIRRDVNLPLQDVGRVCQEYGVRELALFGSALRDDFRLDSDLDFLVTFENDDCGPWMSKLTEFETALSDLLQREVDVVLRRGVEQSRNWLRRRTILDAARVVYAA